MIDREWNELGEGMRMMPITRGPNIFCSNTYIIDAPEAVIVIDPGAGDEHDAFVSDQVLKVLGKKRCMVLLTHSHFDHSRNVLVGERMRTLDPTIAVHRFGALAIESADQDLIQSKFFGQAIRPVKVGIHLFSGSDSDSEMTEVKGTDIKAIHTPGHSPDSVCYLLGDVLFTGDLLFSADPGVAGLEGWDRADLIKSAESLQALIEREGVRTICPGHGRVMDVERARPMLESVSRLARLFESRDDLPEDVRDITYVEELMAEVKGLIPLLSRTGGLSGPERERLLDAFEEMQRSLREEGKVELYHALKARGILQQTGAEDGSIEYRLLKWIDRLVEGIMVASRGLVQHHIPEPTDIDALLSNMVDGLRELFDALYSEQMSALDVEARLSFTMGGAGMAMVEGGRFGDSLMSLIEVLIRASGGMVNISSSRGRGRVRIFIHSVGPVREDTALLNRLRSIRRRMLTCGAEMEHEVCEGFMDVSVTMPAA
jgi:glyoxylase-like metal-dependent hydrolase (beta-lactamase superfamily II)